MCLVSLPSGQCLGSEELFASFFPPQLLQHAPDFLAHGTAPNPEAVPQPAAGQQRQSRQRDQKNCRPPAPAGQPIRQCIGKKVTERAARPTVEDARRPCHWRQRQRDGGNVCQKDQQQAARRPPGQNRQLSARPASVARRGLLASRPFDGAQDQPQAKESGQQGYTGHAVTGGVAQEIDP